MYMRAIVLTCLSILGAVPAFAQTCPIESPANCQPFDDSLRFSMSDHSPWRGGSETADTFRPLTDTLTQVCVWSRYARQVGDATTGYTLVDCADDVSSEQFYVTVYSRDACGRFSP